MYNIYKQNKIKMDNFNFKKYLAEGKLYENSYEVQEDQARMFIRIHDILDKGGHDEERADLAEFIRDTFNGEGGNEEMLRSMGFTEV